MKRIIAALVLLALTGAVCHHLKVWMDIRSPEFGVPQLKVAADTQTVDTIRLAGYDWIFGKGTLIHPTRLRMEIQPWNEAYETMKRTDLNGGETLRIEFSDPRYTSLVILRRDWDLDNWVHQEGDLTVPYENKTYFYDIRAEYAGSFVEYYLKISITTVTG